MADVALTRIEHGLEDGTVIFVEQGEKVDKLPAEVVKNLKALGVIAEGVPINEPLPDFNALAAENAELKAQVEELKAQLAVKSEKKEEKK